MTRPWLSVVESEEEGNWSAKEDWGDQAPSRRSWRERSKIAVRVAGSSDPTNLGSKGEKRVFSAEQ